MNFWPILLSALLWPAALNADEIQTKDGKKVEFKQLIDEGDHLELTTPQGTKVTVMKADFDKYIPSGVKEVPLTGASFTFDKKRKVETLDLLAKFDPKKDVLTGNWKLSGHALTGTGPAESQPKVEFNSYTPPEEYDLTLAVERREGVNSITVVLTGGGKQFAAIFDWFNGSKSAMFSEVVPGRFLTNKVPRTITFMVRKEGVVVRADGKDFIIWKAEWDKVGPLSDDVILKAKNTIGIRIVGPDVFNISALTVTAPKEKP